MRSRALAFGCLLLGSALALLGGAQPWWRATGEGVVLRFTGTQATGGLSQALAIVALAGTLLMLALRTRGRRVVGALLLLVGVGLAMLGGLGLQPNADAVGSEVHGVGLAAFQLSATVWPWVFAVSGALVAIGGALTMITAGTWPARSNRFQPGQSKAEVPASEDPAELWKAMDSGADPTIDARAAGNTDASVDARAARNTDDEDTAKVPYPDVRNCDPGDTMDDTGGRRGLQEREE
jgi:uncharacterized membrane protein (TIGR02234 family)